MVRFARVNVCACGLISGLALSACFVGYDSRYFEPKQSQQRFAAQTAPSAIAATPEAPRGQTAAHRALRLRMRPNARYLAQTVDAPKRVADLVADANGVLGPTLALALEVERIEPWQNDMDQNVEPALAALKSDDPGSNADIVVGLIGALPRPTDSLHEVGMASQLGQHIVLRAASRLAEHDAIDRGLYELSEDERLRVVRTRARHRALAVFLHELGHTLGAVHDTDDSSLMQPNYSTKMTGFGDATLALMRAALDNSDRTAIVRAQLAVLRGAGPWVPTERDEAIARLESALTTSRSPLEAEGTPGRTLGGGASTAPAQLVGTDRDRFLHARELFDAGRVAPAYETAKPLFAAFPNVLAVQDLRCQLASVRWLDPKELKSECAEFIRLSGGADAGPDSMR